MTLWIAGFLLLCALAAAGFFVLHAACARWEPSADWEERYLEKNGTDTQLEAFRAGRDWLSRQETEEIEVQSEDGFILHALLVPHIAPRATLLLFHGWRSSWELDFMAALPFLHGLGLQLLLVDQRAQGDSEGDWITLGVRERTDVPVWADYIAQRFGKEHPVFLCGSSMGAETVLLAADYGFSANIRGIVADSAAVSPYALSLRLWYDRPLFPAHLAAWLLYGFARVFIGFDLFSRSVPQALSACSCPVLFLHGSADSRIPVRQAQQCCEACRSGAELVLIEGAEHCMAYDTDKAKVEEALQSFFDRHITA